MARIVSLKYSEAATNCTSLAISVSLKVASVLLLTMMKQVSHHSQRMGGVNAVALSGDQTTVLTVGQEKRVTYWDLRERHPVFAKVMKRESDSESHSSSPRTKLLTIGPPVSSEGINQHRQLPSGLLQNIC